MVNQSIMVYGGEYGFKPTTKIYFTYYKSSNICTYFFRRRWVF